MHIIYKLNSKIMNFSHAHIQSMHLKCFLAHKAAKEERSPRNPSTFSAFSSIVCLSLAICFLLISVFSYPNNLV